MAELTDNRFFQIRAFPAGEIAPGLQVLDAVQNGTIECGQAPLYRHIGKDPTLSFFASIPFGGNFRQQGAWMKRGAATSCARRCCASSTASASSAAKPGRKWAAGSATRCAGCPT